MEKKMINIDDTGIPCVYTGDFHPFEIVGNYLIYNNCSATLKQLKKGFSSGEYLHYNSYWCFCLKIVDEHDYFEFIENNGWQKLKDCIKLCKNDVKNKDKWHNIIDDIDKEFRSFSRYAIIEALTQQKLFIGKLSRCQSPEIRQVLASEGFALSRLIDDTDDYVRREVAKQGYGLEFLIKDKSVVVRAEVAGHGFGLATLVYDKSPDVRKVVAEQGYALDVLIYDKSPYVRAAVANQGYGLDKLLIDRSLIVRKAVAKHYQYAKILKNDKVGTVREVALKTLSI